MNVKAPLFIAQSVARRMVDAGGSGSIVNISSQSSTRVLDAHVVYSSAKAALDMMTKCMAFELGPKQVLLRTTKSSYIRYGNVI